MSPGSEPSVGHNIAGGPIWPPSSFGSRATSSSSNISQAQLAINTNLPPRSTSLSLSTAMGQSFTKSNNVALSPSGPPPSPSNTPRGLSAAVASGMKLKRAFANRRKKSEDATKIMMDRSHSRDETSVSPQDQFLRQQQRIQATPSSSSSPAKVTCHSFSVPSHHKDHTPSAQHFTQLVTQVFNVGPSKKSVKASQQQPQHLPPPPPPKPTPVVSQQLHTQTHPPPLQTKTMADVRSSIIPISPGISSAVDYIRMKGTEGESQKEQSVNMKDRKPQQKEDTQAKDEIKEEKSAQEPAVGEKVDAENKDDLKDAWRKSDSTIGHHTIRPGGRPSRPVSMADSLQSNHTIVPVTKRQSALITDADFGMPEEDDSNVSADEHGTPDDSRLNPTNNFTSSTSDSHHTPGLVQRSRDHRSMSLTVNTQATLLKQKLPPTPSSASAANLTHSLSEQAAYISSATQRLPTKFPAYITPSAPANAQTTGTNIRGKLAAAWTSSAQQSQATTPTAQQLPHLSSNPYTTFTPPPEHPQTKSNSRLDRSLPSLPLQAQPRQPTLSMSGGFGLAKRAVEKMGLGRALGISTSNTHHAHAHTPSNSGYSSSSSSGLTNTPPSSYNKQAPAGSSPGSVYNNELSRTSSSQSQSQGGHHGHFLHMKNRLKHSAQTPSVSSITSASTSASDSDAMHEAPMGPSMGKQLRGPLKRGGGMVFGRDLKSVVRETGVGVGKTKGRGGRWRNWDGSEGEVEKGGSQGLEDVAVARTRKGSVRKGQLKALEDRKLPSLVVRCAQHLLIWGVQEEGLFRIPGRALHVSRLRVEFDNGADFDMTECSPGDLDPHAVASVFKAFLRELPEPILTNALLPYFDAAMTQEGVNNANNDAVHNISSSSYSKSRGPGLPPGPRNSSVLPTMRKPPSLSTLAMPNLTGLCPPSESLLITFRALLAQLPEENRDLIRTVAELIRATALDSRETKMPLSNLLLVFCPSLNMNPPLLRIICEADGIWDDPVPVVSNVMKNTAAEDGEESDSQRDDLEEDGERESLQSESVGRTSEDVQSSLGYFASTEDVGLESKRSRGHRDDESSSQWVRQDTHDRKPSLAASSIIDDGSSYLSTSEDRPCSDVHSRPHSPQLLTSSAESLDTPDSSSLPPSVPHLPIGDGLKAKQQETLSPIITGQSPTGLSPSTPRRPVISNPIPTTGLVQFPATRVDSAPPSPSKLERRRSIPILSLPNLSLGSSNLESPNSPTLSSAARAKRLKKPSLHLLFSKKSSSSFTSSKMASPSTRLKPAISDPYLQAPQSASDSSISTPLSAVTAPQSSPYAAPPKLDTPIDNSSLQLDLGIPTDAPELPAAAPTGQQKPDRVHTAGSRPLPAPPELPPSLYQDASASAASLAASSSTPIADRYHRSASPYPSLSLASKSQVSINAPEEYDDILTATHARIKPTSRSRGLSTLSNESSSHLDLLDGERPEEWTRSVLLAADADNEWIIKQSTAKA